jgi:hypothetical protein
MSMKPGATYSPRTSTTRVAELAGISGATLETVPLVMATSIGADTPFRGSMTPSKVARA